MLQSKDTVCQIGLKKQKQEPTICCLEETHLKAKDTNRLKVRGWEKIFHGNENDRKVGITMLILDKTDFKTKP